MKTDEEKILAREMRGMYSNSQNSKSKRGTVYTSDKGKILRRQKSLCAGKECKKLHNGTKMPVNIMSHFDHIVSLGLGGKNIPSNMQALCANCHQLKTREDRKLISLKKKRLAGRSNESWSRPLKIKTF